MLKEQFEGIKAVYRAVSLMPGYSAKLSFLGDFQAQKAFLEITTPFSRKLLITSSDTKHKMCMHNNSKGN